MNAHFLFFWICTIWILDLKQWGHDKFADVWLIWMFVFQDVLNSLQEKLSIMAIDHFALVLQNMKSPSHGKMTLLQEHESLAEVGGHLLPHLHGAKWSGHYLDHDLDHVLDHDHELEAMCSRASQIKSSEGQLREDGCVQQALLLQRNLQGVFGRGGS